MGHEETRRLVPGAKCAVLFLHGIVGTPDHFRIALPLEELVPDDCSLVNLRYPGHGGDVAGFGKSSIDAWRCYANEAFRQLAETHERVILVGHSMGTLFAMQMALERPEKVGALLLVAVPLRPWVRAYGAVNCMRLAFNCIREDRPMEVATRNVCGVTPTPLLWRYMTWIPRMLELFGEIAGTEKQMGKLQVPGIAWQSRKDELVSNMTAKVLRKQDILQVRELENSSHFYYDPADAGQIQQYFLELMKKISG